ncbi:MAG TPA: deiodinase-like protein [Vicinamibacterales bacterium]|nr:deiodinase-like protein [Vicinamibacterales bacterium]
MEYRYPHFRRELMVEDMRFAGGPRPGERFPAFDLPTTDGKRVRSSDYQGRPLLITLGSSTCPMTASAGPLLKRLYDEFGERVGFLMLYVREAHPGEYYPQPATFQQKVEHARVYKKRDDIPWDVAVDDLDGSLHRVVDPKPNAAYILDPDGIVVLRTLWSNYEPPLRDGLKAVAAGMAPADGDREPRLVPMLRGVGQMDEILSFAGGYARTDVLRQVPPIYAVARLASGFRPLPPLACSTLAMIVMVATVGGIAMTVRRAAHAG